VRNHIPDLVEVDAEVIVDQDIAHGDDLRPGNDRMFRMKVAPQLRCRLTQNLKMVYDPNLDQFVRNEAGVSPGRVLLNAINGIDHVVQTFSRIPHSLTASRKTRSRMRGLMPRSLTTSTLR